MSRTLIKIGPADHGRRMSLEDFDRAEVQEGHLYELSRGVITVSDVPGPRHFVMVNGIRRRLTAYDVAFPGRIFAIGGGGECKLLLAFFQSERHPDIAIYKNAPPPGDDVWARWVPEVAIEVISPGSEERDYGDKREEYLEFGVREYWIINAERREMLVLKRTNGHWSEKTIRPPRIYKTRLFPGLEIDCGAIFDAADAVGR